MRYQCLIIIAFSWLFSSFGSPGLEHIAQGYALIIGTTEIDAQSIKQKRFPSEKSTLQYGSTEFVDKDVSLIKGMLRYSGFATNNVTELVGPCITAAALRQALKSLTNKAKPGDLVFIYFTGHGDQIVDINKDEDDGLDEALVLCDDLFVDDEIASSLDHFAADVRCVLVVDACHSGSSNKFVKNKREQWKDLSTKNFFEGDVKGQISHEMVASCRFRHVNSDATNGKKIIYLGASADNQKAKGTIMGSYFTTAFWTFFQSGDGGWRTYTYRSAYCELQTRVNSISTSQTVHYEEDGKADFAFKDYLLKIKQ